MQRRGAAHSTSSAVLLAVALATGIWWSDRLEGELGAALALLAGCAALAVPILRRSFSRPLATPLLRTGLALSLVVCTGALRFEHTRAYPHAVPPVDEELVTVEGRVARTARSASGRRRVLLDNLRAAGDDRIAGSILVYLSDHMSSPPVGASVSVRGRRLPFPVARNPGEFDYGLYLARRGVHTTLLAQDAFRVTAQPGRVASLTAAARRYVDNALRTYVSSPDSRTLLRALVLGDRSEIAPEISESFVVTGLVHLLAVSGLHVMIVGLLLYRLSGPLLLRMRLRWTAVEPVRVALTLSLLLAYALLTGRPTSVVRAVVMTAAMLGGPVLRRRTHSLNSLGVAATFILWTQPHSLFEPGFQLSVSAVAGILVLVPQFEYVLARLGHRGNVRGYIMTGLFVSLAATLSTLPVLLVHFGRASFAGIPLNLVAIPITAAALCSTVLCLVFGPHESIAAPFGATADVCIRILIEIASSGSRLLSSLTINTPAGTVGLTVLFACILALICIRSRAHLVRIATAGLLTILLLRIRPLLVPPTFDVVFFDVGQGDAALLRTPSGKSLLVDTGPAGRGFDAGARTILPYLLRQHVDRLDAIVLTHAHADHVGGTLSILRGVEVDRIVVTEMENPSATMGRIYTAADSAGVHVRRIAGGDTLQLDPDLRIFVLSPAPHLLNSSNENNRSIVLKIEYGSSSLLLMGDAEETAEKDVLLRYRDILPADVIKVGHHGSSTSSRHRFVAAATVSSDHRASWAVVSVGLRNRYRHPSTEVLQRWVDSGMQTVTTARSQAVYLSTDGERFRWREWRRGRTSYSQTSEVYIR